MSDNVNNDRNPFLQDPTKLTTDAVTLARKDIEKLYDEKLNALKELILQKFEGVKTEFLMRDTALQAAFKAAETQITQQNASNSLAINKAADDVTKQLKGLDEKIEDLKATVREQAGTAKSTVALMIPWGMFAVSSITLILLIAPKFTH
jgi:hypothetical protein